MADKLTVQQAQAVYDRGGTLLVSAAAGSGKTKVLVDRLLKYLTDEHDPANLDDFLIITYTKAAATELRGKIAAKLTEQIAQDPENRHLQRQLQRLFLTKISTVHGFCADLLREYAYKLDLSADFRVADENECREIRESVLSDLLDRAYESAGDDPDFQAFVDSQGLGRDDRAIPQIMEKVYDSARCHLDPNRWLEMCLDSADGEAVADAGDTIWGRFLMEDLFAYLDCQIHIFRECVEKTMQYPEMEKAARNLQDTLYSLELLRGSESWDDVVRRRNVEYGRLTFPKKNPDGILTDRIKAARNACKKDLEKKLRCFSDGSSQLLHDMQQTGAAARGLVSLVRQFDRDYQSAKKSRRCLDFSDLEHKTLDLLLGKSRGNPTAAAFEISKRYREVLVDEYQDSNGVQDAIFTALTKEKNNCFLVGDVKQSIYQFRLADPNIFLEKYQTFLPIEEAVPGKGRKVLLSHNFRSGPEVIEGVNDVFGLCMCPAVGGLHYGEPEALREGIPHEPIPGAGVELYAIDVQEKTYEEEAAFTADKIQSMLESGLPIRKDGKWKPVEPEDIVILLRSPGSAGACFQRALEARGIRCSSGGGTDLLQTEEIGVLRAFLQTIMNPRQDIYLISTLASPVFGFTADDLASFRAENKQGSVYDALLESDMPKAKQFLTILKELRREAQMSSLTVLLEKCFLLTRLDSIYASMEGAEARKTNLQTFFQLAAEFEKTNQRDLTQFLLHLDAMEERGLLSTAVSNSGCVSIMSIHKSKGLEFPVVFLCNLSRKFNMEDTHGQVLCDKSLGLGLSVADSVHRIRYPSVAKRAIAVKMAAQSVSEEMRVLYVAMTRARDRLIMTYASQTLEADLQDIALRMDFDRGALLCRDAICMGDWILLAAMQRTEAGELHAIGGKPAATRLGKYPWSINVVQAPAVHEQSALQQTRQTMPENAVGVIKEALHYRYPYIMATSAPSKQTATDRKGRIKDEEAAAKAQEKAVETRVWRKASFRDQSADGKTAGSATHAAMQYLRYESCESVSAVEQEIGRLVQMGYLSQEQAKLVNCAQIRAFFDSELGSKLRGGAKHIREFKFSILDDGMNYAKDLEGEKILLQGVVDCALLEEDGITVIDFKTDHVNEDTIMERAEQYRHQVRLYADALRRIYEMPVKAKYLYFFKMNRFIEV